MLLPRDPFAAPEEEEDPRKDLVDQLLEYQKYKAAAQMLWSRATVERAVFKRAEIETDKNNPEVAVGLFDLLKVFQEILARHKEEVLLEIEREEISMTEMLERLRNMVMSAGELNLRVFFERAPLAPRVSAGVSFGAGTGAIDRNQVNSGRDFW